MGTLCILNLVLESFASCMSVSTNGFQVLILDLDETLVANVSMEHFLSIQKDLSVESLHEFINGNDYFWIMRDHYKEFLATCESTFPIIGVYSAAPEKYVQILVDHLFSKKPAIVFSGEFCLEGWKVHDFIESKLETMFPERTFSAENILYIDDRPSVFVRLCENGDITPDPSNVFAIPEFSPCMGVSKNDRTLEVLSTIFKQGKFDTLEELQKLFSSH